MSIVGGTCFTDAVVNDTHVADIVQPPQSAHCSWLMLAARGLGTAVITVYDIGISPPVRTSATVSLLSVSSFYLVICAHNLYYLMEYFISWQR